jgi:hypothetical protein
MTDIAEHSAELVVRIGTRKANSLHAQIHRHGLTLFVSTGADDPASTE